MHGHALVVVVNNSTQLLIFVDNSNTLVIAFYNMGLVIMFVVDMLILFSWLFNYLDSRRLFNGFDNRKLVVDNLTCSSSSSLCITGAETVKFSVK